MADGLEEPLGVPVAELDCVTDAVPDGLAVLVTLLVAERLAVCVVLGVLDMDCEAVWL